MRHDPIVPVRITRTIVYCGSIQYSYLYPGRVLYRPNPLIREQYEFNTRICSRTARLGRIDRPYLPRKCGSTVCSTDYSTCTDGGGRPDSTSR